MFRSAYLIGASALALSACQPAENAAETLEAEAPPVIEEVATEVVSEEVAETDEATAPEDAAIEAEEHDDDHDHDDHDHDEHDHDAHDHDEDHDAHEEHDHDHDHGDREGGEAHVHGLSELAASLDGATLSISIEGALANFDLDETLRTLDDTAPYASGTVSIVGGDCTQDSAEVSIRPIGDHGNLLVDLTYTCGAADAISGIEVTGFQSFAGFEQVNAVFLTDTSQTAETLTESDTRLDIG